MTTIIDDLPTVYNAKETEETIYKFWEDNEFFKADSESPKEPFNRNTTSKCYRGLTYGTCIG